MLDSRNAWRCALGHVDARARFASACTTLSQPPISSRSFVLGNFASHSVRVDRRRWPSVAHHRVIVPVRSTFVTMRRSVDRFQPRCLSSASSLARARVAVSTVATRARRCHRETALRADGSAVRPSDGRRTPEQVVELAETALGTLTFARELRFAALHQHAPPAIRCGVGERSECRRDPRVGTALHAPVRGLDRLRSDEFVSSQSSYSNENTCFPRVVVACIAPTRTASRRARSNQPRLRSSRCSRHSHAIPSAFDRAGSPRAARPRAVCRGVLAATVEALDQPERVEHVRDRTDRHTRLTAFERAQRRSRHPCPLRHELSGQLSAHARKSDVLPELDEHTTHAR